MTRIAAALALALAVSAAPASAQTPASNAANAALDKQLVANERSLIDSIVKKDMPTFKSLAAPDAVAVDGAGVVKGPMLEAILSQQQITASALDNIQVHSLGTDAALVTSRWTGKGTFLGMPLPSPTVTSTLWMKRGGKWLAVFHQQSTAIAMPMPMPAAKK